MKYENLVSYYPYLDYYKGVLNTGITYPDDKEPKELLDTILNNILEPAVYTQNSDRFNIFNNKSKKSGNRYHEDFMHFLLSIKPHKFIDDTGVGITYTCDSDNDKFNEIVAVSVILSFAFVNNNYPFLLDDKENIKKIAQEVLETKDNNTYKVYYFKVGINKQLDAMYKSSSKKQKNTLQRYLHKVNKRIMAQYYSDVITYTRSDVLRFLEDDFELTRSEAVRYLLAINFKQENLNIHGIKGIDTNKDLYYNSLRIIRMKKEEVLFCFVNEVVINNSKLNLSLKHIKDFLYRDETEFIHRVFIEAFYSYRIAFNSQGKCKYSLSQRQLCDKYYNYLCRSVLSNKPVIKNVELLENGVIKVNVK